MGLRIAVILWAAIPTRSPLWTDRLVGAERFTTAKVRIREDGSRETKQKDKTRRSVGGSFPYILWV